MTKRLLDMPHILQAENSNYLQLLRKVGYLFSDSPSHPPTSTSKDKFQLPNSATPTQPLLYIIFTFSTLLPRPKIPSFWQRGSKCLLKNLVQNIQEYSNLWEFTPKSILHNMRRSVCPSMISNDTNPLQLARDGLTFLSPLISVFILNSAICRILEAPFKINDEVKYLNYLKLFL